MNVELLEDIKTHILAEPKSFRMDRWTCGTAHCIAGWACLLTGHELTPGNGSSLGEVVGPDPNPGVVARRELGVSHYQGSNLFAEVYWPLRFQTRPKDSYRRRAQRAAARIDHFIATRGAE